MMNAQENTDSIYRLLIHKKFRSGPKPTEWQEEKIKQKIKSRVEDNLPVHLFQFWGGCKNPNLESPNADICEWHTLNQLSKINEAVQSVYSPGLHITLFPGDERVHRVNHIPMEITTNYVKGLKQISNQFGNLFDVVAVSELYNKYNKEINNAIQATELLITENIFTNPSFQLLVSNAKKNIYKNSIINDNDFINQCQNASRAYIVLRVAEEEAKIYRAYNHTIRCSFIRFSPFFSYYKKYIPNINSLQPALNAVLHFYTGGKGNITQPWQAQGIRINPENNKIIFLSQQRILEKTYLPE